MKITYAAKSNRKELVKALVALTSQPPTYSGPPTYNYYVGDYTVDRNGDLVLPDNLNKTVVDELTASLENMGFTNKEDISDEHTHDEPEAPQEDELSKVTLSFPVAIFTEQAIERMRAIVASKASLLKKALDTETLDIVVDGDKVYFPWFTDHGIEGECDAYSKLAFAIAKMAIIQTRVVAKEKQNPDEKLAMRLFLIRLGFIGDEYKSARTILMRNFDSHESRKQALASVELCMPEVSISSAKHITAEPAEVKTNE